MNEPKAEPSGRGKSNDTLVYVVDDEPMLLELASVILEPLGYAVEAFRSPEAALRAFEAAEPKPDLIVTDFAMHTMTGLELTEACRRRRPKQKVLLVSGTVGPEVIRDGPYKPDSFLPKPYQAQELTDAVKALLEG